MNVRRNIEVDGWTARCVFDGTEIHVEVERPVKVGLVTAGWHTWNVKNRETGVAPTEMDNYLEGLLVKVMKDSIAQNRERSARYRAAGIPETDAPV